MIETASVFFIQDAINGEISQEANLNAYTRLFLLPKSAQVAKVCCTNWEQWEKNTTNLLLICERLSGADFPELVMPTKLLTHEGKTVGYLMPFIEGKSLDAILTERSRTAHEICRIFDRIASVINRLPDGICVGDLHEKNVLVADDDRVFFVDVDGFTVKDGYRLTCPIGPEWHRNRSLPKEKYYNRDGSVRIGKDTDILCLAGMFLSRMTGGLNPYQFSRKRLRLFLRYLRKKGAPSDAVRAFRNIVRRRKNDLPEAMFSSLADVVQNISYEDYIHVMKLWKKERRSEQYIDRLITKGGK